MSIENILGWVVIVAFPLGVIWGTFKFIVYTRKKNEAWQNEIDKRHKELAKRTVSRDQTRRAAEQYIPKNQPAPKYSSTANQSTTSTASQPVNNWSDDLLTTMIIADMLTNNKDVSAGTVKWKDDTPTYTETYSKPSPSFGLDDDDSRKSASSSFSSSDSDSSWSSSSSDSGPSSDW